MSRRVTSSAAVVLKTPFGPRVRACLALTGHYYPGSPESPPAYSHGGIPGDPGMGETHEALLEEWTPEGDEVTPEQAAQLDAALRTNVVEWLREDDDALEAADEAIYEAGAEIDNERT